MLFIEFARYYVYACTEQLSILTSEVITCFSVFSDRVHSVKRGSVPAVTGDVLEVSSVVSVPPTDSVVFPVTVTFITLGFTMQITARLILTRCI